MSDEELEIKVEDKRHWANEDVEDDVDDGAGPNDVRQPTIIDQYRKRAEEAEARLHEYIEAFKQSRDEQEQFRSRLRRDVDRRVTLKFSELVRDLLETVDDLDLALDHAGQVPEAKPLADGVALARRTFLEALHRHGVERIDPTGEVFDPEVAEALRMDPVDAERDGKVTETLRAGYRIGDQVVRAARVAVGKRS